jgi:hypothetical protein
VIQAGVRGAVAGERHRDARFVAVAKAHRHSERDRQRMWQVADEADDAALETRHAVKVRVAAVRRAGVAAQQTRKGLPWCHAADQKRAEVAMHRRYHIAGSKRVRAADGDRLVSALAERTADTTALLPVREHALVERAGELHPVVDIEFLCGSHGRALSSWRAPSRLRRFSTRWDDTRPRAVD